MNENTPQPNNETLIAEIKEEIGRERLENFFKKFKKPLIGLIAFIIIGFSGYEIFKHQAERARQEVGNVLYSALSTEGKEEAIEKLKEVGSVAGAAQLAQLTKAKLMAEKGDIDQAVQAYEDIYSNKSNNAAVIDLARINAANLLMNLSPKALEIDEALESDFDGPFGHNLKELSALNFLNNGKNEEAVTLLKELTSDPNTPTSINLRAKNQLSGLGVDLDEEVTAEVETEEILEPASNDE